MFQFDLHCSQLADWAVCEKSKVWRTANAGLYPERDDHVATWIGTMVHAVVAGQESVPTPNMLVFDEITPTLRIAQLQIVKMASAILRRIRAEGWTVLSQEDELHPYWHQDWLPGMSLVGRSDLVAQTIDWTVVLADIKTAREFRSAWLQLGGYAILYHETYDMFPSKLATIHCPRPAHLEGADVTIYYCDTQAAMTEARRVANRVSDLMQDPDKAVAAPGNRCRYCDHPDCPVRSVEQQP